MANENASATSTEPRSNTPLLIIGGVLVVALLGGWWFYSSSKSNSGGNSNNNSATIKDKKGGTIPQNAPPGAQPPQQQGSPTAAVTVEEFADFQCPQCAMQHPNMNEIKSMYGSRIHFIFREYPLDIKAHDKSYEAAVAAEAAGLQGKFWEMQNQLFSNQKAWTDNPNYKQLWKDYAQRIGIDIPKWENDQAGFAARSRVEEDKKRGKGIGLVGTPSVFINGVAVGIDDMTVDNLKKLIDAELAKGAQPAQGQEPQNGQPQSQQQPQKSDPKSVMNKATVAD
jgi:protein-disulfide isomerase